MATDARETKHDTHVEVTVSKVAERRRQGRFQPLRRLFGRRKKREAQIGFSTGKGSNGVVSDDETDQHLRELNPVVPRALSHDSIFTPEELEAGPDQTMSQENVSDKVRNLQRQIAQSIKFGQRPPSLRKSEGDEGSSDEEELPLSPLKVLAQVEAEPAEPEPKQILGSQQVHGAQQAHAVHGAQQAHAVHGAQQVHAVHGAQQAHAVHGAQQAHAVHGAQQAHAVHGAQQAATHSTPVKSPRSKRVLPPNGTIESINLDAVPQSVPRLDNTFAKHKLSVKPKNQRVSRKHRRCTQDLHGVSLPDVLHEDMEAAGVSADDQRHMAAQEERWEMRRKRELEEQSIRLEEMEKTRRAEEKRLRELEEEKCRKLREEEERRIQEEEAEKRRREEEERRIREEEELRHREEEERIRREEIIAREEQERRQLEEETRRHLEEQCKREEEERRKKEEERRQLEEERRCLKEKRLKEEEEERRKRLEEEKQRLKETQRKEEEEQRKRLSSEEAVGSADVQERKRRAEELRWREMEERQRPFSFKVSSGEKQILFQKVNLTPVTPASSQQGGTVADQREGVKASSPEGADSPNLPSSQYVPHTAILVTGAQLCGTAVNLDQIKDTACKSLLGFGEDRKAQGTPPPKSKTSPDRKSDKTKSLNESMLSTDQAGAAVLAEWASIRSKIFKGAEEGKYEDYPDPSRSQTGVGSQDANQPPFSHTNLRKTMSASTKFSITPAKKKFGDSNRNSDLLSPEDKDAEKEAAVLDTSCSSRTVSPAPASKSPNRTNKTARIVDRGSEECMFAKDLPSFLVPGHESRAEGVEMKGGGPGQAEGAESSEEMGQDGEDQPSPFGIKLRRTNFSLRFHSEQSTEKRKKRYSAGDSFDGVPSPLTPLEPDSDASSVFSPTSPLKESGRFSHPSASPSPSPVALRAKPGKSPSPAVHTESEKVLSKTLLYQRPAASLKQAGSVATPPPSPLPKVGRKVSGEYSAQRAGGGGDSSSVEQADTKEETSAVAQLQRSSQAQTPEEEPKEKKSFFPSINIPWRDKVDRKTELIRKDKPSLQSRHSLDSSRVQDKEAGPLWITLALQKQKGFREQQQSREERRSQREARLVERQSKESVALVSHTDGRGSGGPGPCKLPTPEEPRRPDSLLGRFERREHLKKANTLPSSVTVEITDSTPSPPAVKEVSKRFPATDTPQVSTEPAWLALAKRKAKAWSDCPQIIK